MGRIQSIQSFSTFDGPGSRCVVFLQGCPMGCIFCHNPESWDFNSGEELDAQTLLRRLGRFRPFLSNPGLTVSGGEPLAQPQFTLELIGRAKTQGWHVAVDTSGWGPLEPFREITQAADLVIFSIKHPLTPMRLAPGSNLQNTLTNWRTLATLKIPVWLRYVLIPGWSDEPESLQTLGVIANELPNLERLEVLPFNNLAKDKWLKMGKESPIFNGAQRKVTEEQILRAEQLTAWRRPNYSSE
ncbi:MAG TPA: pyruvate formate-lyase 1-activating enzyme [Firmicutes bacterium]|nr:pyruvate formate-lyase 1-activating enzyme [Bacillota bacterium]